MEIINIIEITATILILVSVALVSIPKRCGLYIMIIGQLFWLTFAYITGSWGLFAQNAILCCVNFWGLHSWKKNGIK